MPISDPPVETRHEHKKSRNKLNRNDQPLIITASILIIQKMIRLVYLLVTVGLRRVLRRNLHEKASLHGAKLVEIAVT